MSRAFPTQSQYSDSIYILYQNVRNSCQELNVPLMSNFKSILSGSNEYAQDAGNVQQFINNQANVLTVAYAASIGAPPPYG